MVRIALISSGNFGLVLPTSLHSDTGVRRLCLVRTPRLRLAMVGVERVPQAKPKNRTSESKSRSGDSSIGIRIGIALPIVGYYLSCPVVKTEAT
jgi:hypothetical protein